MKSSTAIKKFLDMQGYNLTMHYPKVGIAEIKEFKVSCDEAEWREFGKQACGAIGEEWEE